MTSKPRAFLLEDFPDMRTAICVALGEMLEITTAETVAEAKQILDRETFHIFLLDLNLPDGSGYDVCQWIKQQKSLATIPIMILSANNKESDRVKGFDFGADDYLPKPFSVKELVARVKSKLRASESQRNTSVFTKLNFKVDLRSQKVFVLAEDHSEQLLNLTPTEFKIFAHFITNEGKIFSREELRKVVWTQETHLSTHTLDTHISSLRKKIGPAGKRIKAVPKKGFYFVPTA